MPAQPAPTQPAIQTRSWIGVTLLFVLAGCAALPFDLAIAQWFLNGKCPEPIRDVLDRSESFAHGIGIVVILLAFYVLAETRRWAMPRLLCMVVGGGLMANLIKLLVGRTRPHAFDFSSGEVWDTMQGFFPLLHGGSAAQSFPSAHTVATVALAVGLTWQFPRGKWLFAGIALLAALQRLDSGSHFLSDVFSGVALGWFLSVGILQGRLTPAWFDRWEQRLRNRPAMARTACGNENLLDPVTKRAA
ncbi:MAG: phosphatase PAP2 family protein [Planctomycetales bacterium]|nr:phosphatase PAP2 family protein [Planctomycetales bacterium]